MRLHKFRLIALFSFIIAVTAFTSCSSDDHRDDLYKIEGFVDFIVPTESQATEFFVGSLTLNDNYITDDNGNWVDPYYIERWDFIDHPDWSYLDIYKLVAFGDGQIKWFDIYVDGNLEYQYTGRPIDLIEQEPVSITVDDRYYDAAFTIVDRLIRNGRVLVEIEGETRGMGRGIPIRFEFGNAVDFYVR